ncbi:expressed unknown protein [Seminavis robusta]|uniref:Uncharacterized protein n=1 Tax=Seminavis robusta TaxID=568900 RepID=A0A9N8DQS1_9STRA|nr:expressed unknown protein [Seminavis robusta]|eukprot:Sro304_g112640.1 n/a (95) ;mRNA; r:61197-61641
MHQANSYLQKHVEKSHAGAMVISVSMESVATNAAMITWSCNVESKDAGRMESYVYLEAARTAAVVQTVGGIAKLAMPVARSRAGVVARNVACFA